MRSPVLRTVGIGVVSLTLASAFAVPAGAATAPSPLAGSSGDAAKTCYANVADVGTFAAMSQNFAPVLDPYDSAAADDVTLAKRCKVRSIQVVGAYTAEGAVDSQTVTFYKDRGGKPGKIINSQTKIGTDVGGGSYDIKIKPVTLKKGTSWVSVVANLDSEAGGQWYWTNSNTQRGALAQWQNPNGGWQYGCLSWTPVQQCLGAGPGPDLAFSLTGR